MIRKHDRFREKTGDSGMDFIASVRETALSAAQKAGVIQMAHFRQSSVRNAPGLYDVKIETDRLCEKAVMATILDRFPDHGILAEESGGHLGSAPFTWIVDPLDGTVNFWRGLPFFCVSIACYRNLGPGNDGINGAPIAGVVYLPFNRELFVAVAGGGAYLNDRPIRVNPMDQAAHAVMTVSFGKTSDSMRRMTGRLGALLPMVRKVRCLGAVAAELGYIAAGYLDGLMYEGIKPWDFAAGRIILEEAGGRLEATEMAPDHWRVLAGTGLVCDTFNPILAA